MGIHRRNPIRGDCCAPTPVALLGQPLEFIHEDHLRERQICAFIDEIAQSESAQDKVLAVLAFLTTELSLHLQDEEEDLFPLLKRRCEPEDEIERVISKLTVDHAHAGDDTPIVVEILTQLNAQNRVPDQNECEVLMQFAAHSRRHLILENAIVLPLARVRLTNSDLDTLYIRMCQRRGLEQLKRAGHEEQS